MTDEARVALFRRPAAAMVETARPAVNRLVRRGLLWTSAARSLVLILLPLPLPIAVLGSLIAGDVERLALAGGALSSFWLSGAIVFRALIREARYRLGERADLPALPLKLLTSVPTGAGAALAALAGGHEPASALVFAALGGAGHIAFFGRDLKPRRIDVAVVDGVDRAAVTRQLEQGHGRLRGIEVAAAALAVPEFRERLSRITAIARSILDEIERDPADAARARRFLNLYLDSAEQVTAEYARTHRRVRHQPLDQHFRQLLVDMEDAFAQQHRQLVERELVSLDVDIEVLNARIRREGPG